MLSSFSQNLPIRFPLGELRLGRQFLAELYETAGKCRSLFEADLYAVESPSSRFLSNYVSGSMRELIKMLCRATNFRGQLKPVLYNPDCRPVPHLNDVASQMADFLLSAAQDRVVSLEVVRLQNFSDSMLDEVFQDGGAVRKTLEDMAASYAKLYGHPRSWEFEAAHADCIGRAITFVCYRIGQPKAASQ